MDKVQLSRPQIEAMIEKKYEDAGFYSYAGQHYITADTLYSVTNDWKLDRKIDLPNFGYLYGFSPDGKYILYRDNNLSTFVSSIDGLETKRLFGGNDYFTGLSADGSTVYYNKNMGRNEGAVDLDGSNKRELPLTALDDYQPYEGVPLEKGVVSRGRSPKRIDRYVVSPDKTQIAFSWFDLLFTVDATDLEFSNPRFVAQLPERPMTLLWSPDGNYLLAGLSFCTNSSCNIGEVIVLLNVQQNRIETIISSIEYKQFTPCGFSPDGHQFVFTYTEPFGRSSWIVLSSVDGKSPPTRIMVGGYIDRYRGCPSWLSDD